MSESPSKRARTEDPEEDAVAAQEAKKKAKLVDDVKYALDDIIGGSRYVDAVAGVEVTHAFAYVPQESAAVLNIQFDVSFTYLKTKKRHRLAMHVKLRIAIESSGRIAYEYREKDSYEDFFIGEFARARNSARREFLISALCQVFGMDVKAARFIAREYVDGCMIHRACNGTRDPAYP